MNAPPKRPRPPTRRPTQNILWHPQHDARLGHRADRSTHPANVKLVLSPSTPTKTTWEENARVSGGRRAPPAPNIGRPRTLQFWNEYGSEVALTDRRQQTHLRSFVYWARATLLVGHNQNQNQLFHFTVEASNSASQLPTRSVHSHRHLFNSFLSYKEAVFLLLTCRKIVTTKKPAAPRRVTSPSHELF